MTRLQRGVPHQHQRRGQAKKQTQHFKSANNTLQTAQLQNPPLSELDDQVSESHENSQAPTRRSDNHEEPKAHEAHSANANPVPPLSANANPPFPIPSAGPRAKTMQTSKK